jgi:urease accessory protein
MPVIEKSLLTPEKMQGFPRSGPSRLDLRFTQDGSATRMSVLRQEPPWRVIRAFPNPQNQALVHLHNVSGGIVAGDSLHLTLEADPCAQVQVTSTGATRIYRTRPDRSAACLSTSIRVGEGALLEYLPDMVIPFSGSCFSQSMDVSLGPNAGFIGWETIAAGRVASGEAFGFDSFISECSIRSVARPLALERYTLTPAFGDPRSIARWGRFRYTASLYVCHTGAAASRWIGLESRLNELAVSRTSDATRWGASTLVANGLVIRGLALEAHQISTGLHTLWDFAKQELWGAPAIPPRKIN